MFGLSRGSHDLLESLASGIATGIAAEACVLGRIRRDRAEGFAAGDVQPGERRFAAFLAILIASEEALGATHALCSAVLPKNDHYSIVLVRNRFI